MYNPEDFKIVKKDKKDFKASVVERSNMKNEFTLHDVENNVKELDRMEKELSSQKSLCEKTCDNITRNHPFVKDLTPEQIHHVWMYQENKTVVDDASAKLDEVAETLDNYKAITDVIYDVGGFVKSDVTETKDDGEKGS